MIIRFRRFFIFNLSLLFILSACKNDDRKIDSSNTQVDVEVIRFEQFLNNEDNLAGSNLENFRKKHPDFIDSYERAVLLSDSLNLGQSLNNFQEYFDTMGINTKIENSFSDFDQEKADFIQMQKKLKTIFPKYQPIDLITMNSGFNYKNFLLNHAIAVGLDMYLGDQVEYMSFGPSFPEYKVHTFEKKYLVPDAVSTIIADLFPDQVEFNTLLDRMIYNGKQVFLKSLVLENAEDHLVLGMTEEDYNWCVENERNIWSYFISEQLLYSNDFNQYKTFVTEGPFSAGMPQESPANTGTYIGWQILRKYAREYPKKSILEIMQNNDSQEILNDSKYRP